MIIFIICSPADSPFAAVGSSFDHFCAECKQRVMVSPSGQAQMKRQKMTVLCTGCGAELEATLSGLHQIASGGIPMCGPCGVWFAEEAARRGSIGGVATTREADASIDRGKDGGNVPLGSRIDRLRKKYPWEKS